MAKRTKSTATKKKVAIKGLTGEQMAQLRKYEAVIRKGRAGFFAVSEAILAIEREHLYVPHRSLTAYCWAVWDMEASDVSRCRKAALVVANLRKGGIQDPDLPANESQARCIQHLTKAAQQVRAWQRVLDHAKETGEKVTAGLIQKLVGKPEPQRNDKPSPQEVPPVYDLVTVVQSLQRVVEELPKTEVPPIAKDALRKQIEFVEELLSQLKLQLA